MILLLWLILMEIILVLEKKISQGMLVVINGKMVKLSGLVKEIRILMHVGIVISLVKLKEHVMIMELIERMLTDLNAVIKVMVIIAKITVSGKLENVQKRVI